MKDGYGEGASRLLFFRGVRRYLVKMICDGKHRRKHQSGEETEIEKQGYYGKSHIRRGLTGWKPLSATRVSFLSVKMFSPFFSASLSPSLYLLFVSSQFYIVPTPIPSPRHHLYNCTILQNTTMA